MFSDKKNTKVHKNPDFLLPASSPFPPGSAAEMNGQPKTIFEPYIHPKSWTKFGVGALTSDALSAALKKLLPVHREEEFPPPVPSIQSHQFAPKRQKDRSACGSFALHSSISTIRTGKIQSEAASIRSAGEIESAESDRRNSIRRSFNR